MVGTAAAVRRPASSDPGSGVATYIVRVATAATHTSRVETAVPNPECRIAAGMTAEVGAAARGKPLAHPVSPAVLTLSVADELGIKTV